MLLLRKSGAVSFDDILTANGLRCITFQQACQEYGLLRDLWVQHQVSLYEDLVHRYSQQTGPHYALADIEELLTFYNLSLQKLHLPTVHLTASVSKKLNFDIVEEQAKANIYAMQLNS
ncbi:hypothetical protein AVEN_133340-1 [Araneus ventricosus]|uniref:Uncharacterized protein n=1 Tax=Araneus ventricosus TaxID=182803 RepID=A0A4Y2DJT9_ARAVE|nr:hypothetical protein AVEN_133340-1 [Araneus ventricosus]